MFDGSELRAWRWNPSFWLSAQPFAAAWCTTVTMLVYPCVCWMLRDSLTQANKHKLLACMCALDQCWVICTMWWLSAGAESLALRSWLLSQYSALCCGMIHNSHHVGIPMHALGAEGFTHASKRASIACLHVCVGSALSDLHTVMAQRWNPGTEILPSGSVLSPLLQHYIQQLTMLGYRWATI